MNKKVYKRLMLAGMVPWRMDVLKSRRRVTEQDKLLRDGWQAVKQDGTLHWKGQEWNLLYKVVEQRPRKLPGFETIDIIRVHDINGESVAYQYIEFMAVNRRDGHAELYAYGNFLKGDTKPYLMRGRQVIRTDDKRP